MQGDGLLALYERHSEIGDTYLQGRRTPDRSTNTAQLETARDETRWCPTFINSDSMAPLVFSITFTRHVRCVDATFGHLINIAAP